MNATSRTRIGCRMATLSLIAISIACGAPASAPTPPGPPPHPGPIVGTSSTPVQSIEIFYTFGLDWLAIGSTFGFGVFAIHADGIYEKVSVQQGVVWTSSDSAVVQVIPTGLGSLRAAGPGIAQVTATYQGFSASVAQEIRTGIPPYPFLEIAPHASPSEEGMSMDAGARWRESNTSFPDVTTLSTWTSSNPTVATVSGGRITARSVGTTRITANYNGASASYTFSVHQSLPVAR